MDTSIETLTIQETFPSFILLEDTNFSEKEIMDMKKEERRQRYINYEGEVDVKFFSFLRKFNLATYELGSERTDTIWDIQLLDGIPLSEDVDRQKMNMFLMPHDNITSKQAEFLLSSNPNHLIATMTILSNNYQMNIYEIDKKLSLEKNGYNSYANFLFTPEEEVIFFTGRTLLSSYINVLDVRREGEKEKTVQQVYMEELRSEIDGVICRYNQGLIKKIAKSYQYQANNDDLKSSGFEGLIKEAIPKFDIDRGYKFATYAIGWLRNHIGREANGNTSIYIPDHMVLVVSQVLSKKYELEQETGKIFSIDDVINICREERKYFPNSNQHIKMAIVAQEELISLDEPLSSRESNDGDNSNKYFKTPGKEDSVEDFVDRKLDKERLYKIIENANLTNDEKVIIKLSYGLIPNTDNLKKNVYSTNEIAKKLGVNSNEVKKIRNNAMKKLKNSSVKGRRRYGGEF